MQSQSRMTALSEEQKERRKGNCMAGTCYFSSLLGTRLLPFQLQGTETRKTLRIVPTDNFEALNICWVGFFSDLKTTLCLVNV
ncbi:unnamed protein product [Bubo scandiacus]